MYHVQSARCQYSGPPSGKCHLAQSQCPAGSAHSRRARPVTVPKSGGGAPGCIFFSVSGPSCIFRIKMANMPVEEQSTSSVDDAVALPAFQQALDDTITPRIRQAITSSATRSETPDMRFESVKGLAESEASLPCPNPNVFLLGLDKSNRKFDDAGFLRILILEDLDENELYGGEEIPSQRHEVPFNAKIVCVPKKKYGISSLEMTWYYHS